MQPPNAIPSWPNTTYTYEDDNRMLTAGSASFEYDDNGNLITKTVGSDVTNYTWDFNDMLTHLTSGGNSYEYRYDGLWGRRARIENSVEKRYVFGLAETDASGNITAYYVYGLGLISKITPSNQSYFYHFDGIASTVGISDSSGNMVNKYAYDAFGKVLNQEETIPNPFKYVGEYGVMDEGNGLFYMWARYYDPESGRFINKDPIGFWGGLNPYTYVGNNPVNWVDPLGLQAESHSLGTELLKAAFEHPPIPSFTHLFPESKVFWPTVDIIIGGIEGGFAIGGIGASVGATLAGPEFWLVPIVLGPISIRLGIDAINRISDAIKRFQDPMLLYCDPY
jgi:RHS repeat-associated protein